MSNERQDVGRSIGTSTALSTACAICLELPSDFDENYMCVECKTICCENCFREYITHKINNGQVGPEQLVCVGPSCNRSIHLNEVHMYSSVEIVQKYIAFLKDFEARQQGHRFCPNPTCGQPLDRQSKRKRRVHCYACHRTSCKKCGDEYHVWPQCNKKYQAWCHTNNTQSCPKCDAMIEKNDGCKHMTCAQCCHQFCWLCRGDWDTHGTVRCFPLACIRSKHRLFGPAPLHVVTKPVVAVVGASVIVAAAGLAVGAVVVVGPPMLVCKVMSYTKEQTNRERQA